MAYFQQKIDSEGQITPFDQNKEEKYISSLFTGAGREPFHRNLLPPFSGLNNRHHVLDPTSRERRHEGCVSLFPQKHTDSPHWPGLRKREAHQGIKCNRHDTDAASAAPVSRGPCNFLKSAHHVLLRAVSTYCRRYFLRASLLTFLPS